MHIARRPSHAPRSRRGLHFLVSAALALFLLIILPICIILYTINRFNALPTATPNERMGYHPGPNGGR